MAKRKKADLFHGSTAWHGTEIIAPNALAGRCFESIKPAIVFAYEYEVAGRCQHSVDQGPRCLVLLGDLSGLDVESDVLCLLS